MIIIVCVVLFRMFIATPVRVYGDSMYSTLKDGEILILNKLDHNFDRFDIVVVKKKNSKRIIKRIIGLPGEKIVYIDNELYINGKIIEDVATARTANFSIEELYKTDTIPLDSCFVMGDNRGNSTDSRDSSVGFVKKSAILGSTSLRLFPFDRIGTFK